MTLSRRLFLGTALCGLAAGCSTEWKTDYSDAISPGVSRNWRVAQVMVSVPETLTVSEENLYAPDADIVWRGEPEGDRRAQVKAIFEEAARRGSADLKGSRPVALSVRVTRFHALSDVARLRLSHSGVHDIAFVAQVNDARTGEILTGPEPIRADLVALTGEKGLQADMAGQTQKVRITDHLSRVFAGWLGAGPDDVRGSFTRLGR